MGSVRNGDPQRGAGAAARGTARTRHRRIRPHRGRLRPPLYATRFHHGFGTLYTAEYRPADGIARYHWPQGSWEQSLNNIKAESIHLQLGAP